MTSPAEMPTFGMLYLPPAAARLAAERARVEAELITAFNTPRVLEERQPNRAERRSAARMQARTTKRGRQ